MKVATIRSSDVALYNRMDAGFHIFRTEHETAAKKLQDSGLTKAEVMTALQNESAVPLDLLRKIEPLSRGNTQSPLSRELLLKAAEEYPYLAMAAVMDGYEAYWTGQYAEMCQKLEAAKTVAESILKVKREDL